MLKDEIKKLVKRKEYIFFFMIMFFAVIFDFLINCINLYGERLSNLYPAYVMTVLDNISRAPFRVVFTLFLPLVVCVAASDTYLLDTKAGINNYIVTRVNRSRYIKTKALAIFLVVFFTIMLNILLSIALNATTFPLYGYKSHWQIMPYMLTSEYEFGTELLGKLRFYHPYINICLWGMLRAFVGATFALFAYGVSFIKKISRYIVLISSFVVYHLISVAEMNFESFLFDIDMNHSIWRDFLGFCVMLNVNPRVGIVQYIYPIILFLIIAIMLIKRGIKKEELL